MLSLTVKKLTVTQSAMADQPIEGAHCVVNFMELASQPGVASTLQSPIKILANKW